MKSVRSLLIASCAAILLVAPMFAFAQATTPTPRPAGSGFTLNEQNTGLSQAAGGTGLGNACPSGGQDCIARIIGNAVNVILSFSGILLLCYLIYGGILWMTAGGDEVQVKKAKQTITNVIAGIVIVGLSFVLSSFILGRLIFTLSGTESTVTGGTAPTPPPPTP